MGLLLGADRLASVSYIQSIKTTGAFGTSTPSSMSLNAQGGMVGVGTSNPTNTLTIFDTYPTIRMIDNGQAGITDTSTWDIRAFGTSPATGTSTLHFRTVNDDLSDASDYLTVTRSGYSITNVNFPHGTVTMSGSVAFGGTLEVTGIIYGHSDIIGYYTSDERLKTNVVSINDALIKVKSTIVEHKKKMPV